MDRTVIWAWIFPIAIVALFAVLFTAQYVPLVHECPKLAASMLEKQPILGCLI